MQEITASICVGETEYTADLHLDSKRVQIYCTHKRVDSGVWACNRIIDTVGNLGEAVYSALDKALVEAMYV